MLYLVIALAIILVAMLIVLALLDGEFEVERERSYHRDIQSVFDKIRDYRAWPEWSPWLMHEPDAELNYSDNTRDVGASYTWDGHYIGAGKIETVALANPREMECRLQFLRPFKSTARVFFYLREVNGQTHVTWRMKSEMPFLFRFMVPKMKSMIGHDYDLGLAMLAGALNPANEHPRIDFVGEKNHPDQRALCESFKGQLADMQVAMEKGFPALAAHVTEQGGTISAPPAAVYHKVDIQKMYFECDMAVPVEGEITEGEYQLKTLPGGKYFQVDVYGSYDFLELAWYSAMCHIEMTKKKYDKKRPSMEVYATDPASVAHSNELKTVLLIPIK